MERRDCIKAIGAAAIAGSVPVLHPIEARANMSSKAELRTEVVRLKLRHTWTTTMSSSDYRDTLFVHYTKDGISGVGEGAPIIRYHEDALGEQKVVESLRALLLSADPLTYDKLNRTILQRVENDWAAKSALDIAILDWVGQRMNVPIHRLLGLDAADAPVTTFSIGIDTPEITRQKTREAEAYPVLKVKVGLDSDEATIQAVRSVTDKPLRVDANEGWQDREVAVRKIEWLQKQNVEFIEQPMAADRFEDIKWIRERVAMPVFADEACLRPSDIPRLAEAYDGVNIKLDKAGGILQGYRMLQMARALGLKTMLGCMISSSVAITAAAQLSPLADYADLDGNLLIGNDPYEGVLVKEGKLILPDRPGLGVRRLTT